MTQVKKTNPSGCLRLFRFDTEPVVKGPLPSTHHGAAGGNWNAGQTSEGVVTETKPEATCNFTGGQPRRPPQTVPLGQGATPPTGPRRSRVRGSGSRAGETADATPQAEPLRQGGPLASAGAGPSPHNTMPQVDAPGPFSVQELSFPVKSLSCLRLGLVLR